ncbi:NEDD8-conjugating enzyme ubc12 [Elysia marginata]|uniref:NEDD8-conjugating enzyme ubc12 n=1 Tax=Elysia marginata TaxID=1093978 RepID=A0AAV4HHR6_9GAST|nr:NEDD8-conjugating enzyme ubc12 [Elysia marginata]
MATAAGDVFKEFHALARNINKLTDGQAQVVLEDEPEDQSDKIVFLLSVCPNDGHYKGATIKFRVCVTSEYPDEAPTVECLNQVYHPNIDISERGQPNSICVNLLGEDWQPEVGLDGCVIAILFLFHHPNQDDALSHVFSGCEIDEEEFAANVKASIRGEEVENIYFEKLVAEEDLKNENDRDAPTLNDEVANTHASQGEHEETGGTAQGMPDNTPAVSTNADAVCIDNGSTDNKTDTIDSAVHDNLQKLDQIKLPECTDLEEKSAFDTVSQQEMSADLPPNVNKCLLEETRPLDVFPYNWKNVSFSFCQLFRTLYEKLKKSHRNDRPKHALC